MQQKQGVYVLATSSPVSASITAASARRVAAASSATLFLNYFPLTLLVEEQGCIEEEQQPLPIYSVFYYCFYDNEGFRPAIENMGP